MTSIHTNVGAISALQTLRSIANQMGDTQNQVSSGLRVGTASDNAAYWSIATTMRSDNMALSAVEDALGLGAAKVDTAYAGMTAVVDVLAEIKSRVVAATEEGVDKAKIQEEIEQLKQQVIGISSSASFSGENWLSTNKTEASVVSSFVRASDGSVSVERTAVDLADLALFTDASDGILDSGSPVYAPDLVQMNEWNLGSGFLLRFNFDGPLTFDDDTTAITFDVTVDDDDPALISNPQPGVTTEITINRTLIDSVLGVGAGGVIATTDEWADVVNAALAPAGAFIGSSPFDPLEFDLMTAHTSGARGSHVAISDINSTILSGLTGGLATASAQYGRPAFLYLELSAPFRLHKGEIQLELVVDGASFDVRVNQQTIDRALGGSNTLVNSLEDYALVLNQAFADANSGYNARVTTFFDGTDHVYVYGNPAVHKSAGANSVLSFDFVSADLGMGLADIDVTVTAVGHPEATLSAMERMHAEATAAAATLGALQSRIDMQTEFVSKLTDSIDSGIGRLVDADMNEASTRLKALQTQEQLAIQSLSIANTNAEGILTLFR